MRTKKTRKIRESLLKKGFRLHESHHHMYTLYVNDKKTSIRTRISHGSKEYSSPLLSMMSKQLKLTNEQLDDFIECPLSYEEYITLLYESGAIAE